MSTNDTPPAHTPAPWSFTFTEDEQEGLPRVYGPDGWHLAEVHGEDNTQREANARLIEQAPAMYEFIAELVDAWNDDNSEDEAESLFADAVNILHRVRGEQ